MAEDTTNAAPDPCECGRAKVLKDGVMTCPWCEDQESDDKIADTKGNRVIRAKIKTKRDQVDDISQTGPGLLIVLGIIIGIIFFGVGGIFIALVIIGIGYWWSTTRTNEEKKLRNEIRELEAELEYS